ncbi:MULTISPECIES: hypothetical protein [Methylobacillus]|uniref:hypothetical protein n=1 Tax=Methylobacillus TaxID=404 RepID=UPI0006624E6B|nr:MULTISPECIES: hypothetical protein [Methylobacillus]MPS47484.1 hypothetical protein [Methylobacillus sp.]
MADPVRWINGPGPGKYWQANAVQAAYFSLITPERRALAGNGRICTSNEAWRLWMLAMKGEFWVMHSHVTKMVLPARHKAF